MFITHKEWKTCTFQLHYASSVSMKHVCIHANGDKLGTQPISDNVWSDAEKVLYKGSEVNTLII